MFGILTSLHNLGPILQLIASGTLWISAAYPLIHRIHSWVPALNNSCYSQPSLLSRLRTVSLCLSGVVSPLLSHGRSPSPSRCRCYLPLSLFLLNHNLYHPCSIYLYYPPPVHTVSYLLSRPRHIRPIFIHVHLRFLVLVYFPSTDIPRRY